MLFSVVTVALNSESTIGDTLTSVRSQQFEDYEHIIIDGASKDGTLDVVRSNQHSRLRWNSEPDGGLYDAMNKGLHMAQGDYVLFLNSDDFFLVPTPSHWLPRGSPKQMRTASLPMSNSYAWMG